MRSGLLLGALLTSLAAAQPRVVLVDVDGVRNDTFEKAYLSGEMPNLERVLGEVRDGKGFGSSLWFENAKAAFPAITMAGQASLATGVPPSRHGIPGNQWFDRETNRVIDYFSSTGISCVYGILLVSVKECSGGLANRHLRVPTMYEAAAAAGKTSTVVFSQYWRGATHAISPSVSEVNLLVRGNAVDYQKFDEIMMDHAVASLIRDGIPDLLTLYFIGADGIGHKAGTPAQAAYLRTTFDSQLGRLLEVLDKLDPVWKVHTQFIFTSDHGRTDTEASAQDAALETNIQKALERGGYVEDQYRIVENGGVVHLYLRSRVMGARWALPPRPEDVEEMGKALAKDASLNAAVELVAARRNGSGYGYTLTREDREDASQIASMLAQLESPRSGDIVLLLRPGRYFGNTEPTGAQHGSMFSSDLAIPLVIAQGGAGPGRSPAPISTQDISPIVAAYLGFTFTHLVTASASRVVQ